MLSNRRFARYVLIAVALVILVVAIGLLADVLLLGFGGVLFAIIIRAGGEALSRHLPISPRWGSLLVLTLLAAGIALLIYGMGGEIARQVSEFQQRLPQAISEVRSRIDGTPLGDAVLASIDEALSGGQSGAGALKAASATFGVLSDLFIVVVLAVYLSFSPGQYMTSTVRLVPVRHQAQARTALHRIARALRQWFMGQALSMIFVGVLTSLGLWLVGVPNAVVLGLIAGLFEFVPVVGTVVAAVPILLLALATGPQVALSAALVYFVIQQLEGALIMPLAQRWAVHLPPAVTLLSVAVFGVLFGFPGVLFATPLAVVIMVLLRQFYIERRVDAVPGRVTGALGDGSG